MDAAEYKHVVLGLIFLKYISDAFEELHQKFLEAKDDYEGADPEDKNEYLAEKVFYVPPSARWGWLQGRAKLPSIGKDIDDAKDAIERSIMFNIMSRSSETVYQVPEATYNSLSTLFQSSRNTCIPVTDVRQFHVPNSLLNA
jgi:type I restriction-modification system DNA methylase subunit